eukprot:CAMPEP_0204005862 /NCGR_PEP_ID=MMETSP0360-20130528/19386_1 /ASSEMBLY_ACC=CAM_ASM_000342 /TAXON_ID=268821 /ORGANISM="Scrippsiella Hangoei, Strain SHTV-5" /LENGTH=199 /DNA_ID=CAMNT_0050947903 /DNA_START=257 /DNA_END=858 /DNA_ORIENTATION=+
MHCVPFPWLTVGKPAAHATKCQRCALPSQVLSRAARSDTEVERGEVPHQGHFPEAELDGHELPREREGRAARRAAVEASDPKVNGASLSSQWLALLRGRSLVASPGRNFCLRDAAVPTVHAILLHKPRIQHGDEEVHHQAMSRSLIASPRRSFCPRAAAFPNVRAILLHYAHINFGDEEVHHQALSNGRQRRSLLASLQ